MRYIARPAAHAVGAHVHLNGASSSEGDSIVKYVDFVGERVHPSAFALQ